MKNRMPVVMLGSGTPNAEPDRSGPAVAVIAGGRAHLVDCGPGVVRRAAAASERGVQTLVPPQLTRVFITHLHSDHTAGLPDLILTPWVLGRHVPLEVFGPPGTKAMVEHLQEAYERDIQFRVHGLEEANRTGWQVVTKEVGPGIVERSHDLTIEAFAVEHGAWEAFGYRFRSPDRTVVISGDTGPTDAVAEMAAGADLLIHEVYSHDAFSRQDPEWQRYHDHMHTSTCQVADVAARARPKLLVLYHLLLWGVSADELVAEVRRGYDGEVVAGRDLEIY